VHCLHRLFEARAARDPAAIALTFEGVHTTYGELNARADRLARVLRPLGIGPEVAVGLFLERSAEVVVAILGILKAGGAYVPLDPTYPAGRLAFLIEDARIPILLTQEHLGDLLPPHVERVMLEDASPPADAHHQTTSPPGGAASGNAAYVIYTSGSTGQPKGVVVEHRSLLNYVLAASEAFAIAPRDRALQFASLSFDAAAEEIFPTLAGGATLVLRPPGMIDSLPTFLERCGSLGLTILDLPTTFWHQLVEHMAQTRGTLPETVRLVIIGGEALQPLIFRLLGPGRRPDQDARVASLLEQVLNDVLGDRARGHDHGEIAIGLVALDAWQRRLLGQGVQLGQAAHAATLPGDLQHGAAGTARLEQVAERRLDAGRQVDLHQVRLDDPAVQCQQGLPGLAT